MKVVKSEEIAFQVPQWFKDLSKKEQDKYLKEHPNSKLSRHLKAKQGPASKPQKDGSEKPVKVVKKQSEKKDEENTLPVLKGKSANDILEKQGSPTDFKGPKSDDDTATKNAKAERKVVSLLKKLADLSSDAKKKGKDAPNYDLCQVSIPGSNLFCKGHKGIERKDMPQLKGKPVPGSWADKNLQKDSKGEVDSETAFKKMLKEKNVKLTKKRVDAAKLRATQKELVGTKVAGMLEALKKDPNHEGITAPIFVSRDGYVLDGHHRWAAMVGLSLADGIDAPVEMNIVEVDMEIEELVEETNNFADEIGIAQKKASTTANLVVLAEKDCDCEDCGCNGKEQVAMLHLDRAHPQLAKLFRPTMKIISSTGTKNSEEYLTFFHNVAAFRESFMEKVNGFENTHGLENQMAEDVSDRGPLNLIAIKFTSTVSGHDGDLYPEDLVQISYERDFRLRIQEMAFTILEFEKAATFHDPDNFGNTKCVQTGLYVSDDESYACISVVARNHENVCMNFYFSVTESAEVLGGFDLKMFIAFDYTEQIV